MITREIVVFGGTGHVGYNLALALVDAGFKVLSISRNPPKPGRFIDHPALRYQHGSVHEPETWRGQLDGAMAVIDAIGILKADKKKGHSHNAMNFEPCRITLEEALSVAVPGFVYISAKPVPGPFLGEYYAAKAKAEALVQKLHPRGLIIRPGIILAGPTWFQNLIRLLPMISTVREVSDQVLDYCRVLSSMD